MNEARACGPCTLCCELPPIQPLNKPANTLCRHAVRNGGCGIYETRPAVCRAFYCYWTQIPELGGEEWRPDQCHFYVNQFDELTLMIMVDPAHPDAWRQEPYYNQIKYWSRAVLEKNAGVFVSIGERMIAVFPEEDLETGSNADGLGLSVGYMRENGKRQPAVARKGDDGEVKIVARGKVYRDVPL